MRGTCHSCGRTTRFSFYERVVEEAGRRFLESMPSLICTSCGQETVAGPVTMHVDLEVAFLLCEGGVFDGRALKLARKSMGYKTIPFSHILGIPEERLLWLESMGPLPDGTTLPTAVRKVCCALLKEQLRASVYGDQVTVIELCDTV